MSGQGVTNLFATITSPNALYSPLWQLLCELRTHNVNGSVDTEYGARTQNCLRNLIFNYQGLKIYRVKRLSLDFYL